MNPNFIDIDQNSDGWFDLRAGKLTGSAVSKVMANYGKAFGAPAQDLATQIAVEQITGNPIPSNYTNSHMDRGHEQEPIARAEYERTYFCEVLNGGFFDNDKTGVSVDGRVLPDGIIEIKSHIPSVHFNNVKRAGINPTYKWQYYFNLKETGADWIDTISFCADFPEGKKLFVHRIWAKDSEEEFEQIESRSAEFFDLVEEKKRVINAIS
jgi:hypothetical protein